MKKNINTNNMPLDVIKKAYDMDDISKMIANYQDMVRSANERIAKGINAHIPVLYGVRKNIFECTPDMFLEEYHHEDDFYQPTYKEYITALSILRSVLIDPMDIWIVNKLIGDKKLFRKIRIVGDGSYRATDIYCSLSEVGKGKQSFYIHDKYLSELYKSGQLSWDEYRAAILNKPKKAINNMYRRYPIIFVRIPLVSNLSELEGRIVDDMHFADEFDNLDFD